MQETAMESKLHLWKKAVVNSLNVYASEENTILTVLTVMEITAQK